MGPSSAIPRSFVSVFRAPSAPMFAEGESLTLKVPTPSGLGHLTIRTRFLDRGFAHRLPGDLWIEGRGPASSIEDAVTIYGNASGGVTPVIAFATNSAIGDLEPEIIFEETAGLEERDFLQSMLPEERPLIHVGRIVNVPILHSLMGAIEVNPEKDRIVRAVGQYSLALRHWRWGHETLAIAHLFMAAEAITKAVVRSMQVELGLDGVELARQIGINPEALRPGEHISALIEPHVRRDIVFAGDGACYRDAKAASDAFEHGFMPFDEIRERARGTRDQTAKYIRKCIIELLQLDNAVKAKLLEPTLDTALPCAPVVKYMKGKLIGSSPKLAAEGNQYPVLEWRSKIKEVKRTPEGAYTMSFDESVTPRIADSVQFRLGAFEVWAP